MNVLIVLFYVIVFAGFVYGVYRFVQNLWFYFVERFDSIRFNKYYSSTSSTNITDYINNNLIPTRYLYFKKNFMTPSELSFYEILKYFNQEYIVIPQVCLSTLIEKKKQYSNSPYSKTYQNDLFKIIDFAIFKKDFS